MRRLPRYARSDRKEGCRPKGIQSSWTNSASRSLRKVDKKKRTPFHNHGNRKEEIASLRSQ